MVAVKTEGDLKWNYLPLELDISHNTKETFIRVIMPHVKPKWRPEKLRILRVNDGLGVSNQLIGYYQDGTDTQERGNVVLLRINGENTQLTNREREVVAMVILQQGVKYPPLYLEFSNGLCYGFAPGRPVQEQDYQDMAILKSILKAIVHIHTIKLPDRFHDNQSIIPTLYDKCLSLVPTTFSDPEVDAKFKSIFSLEELKRETEEMNRLLKTFKSALVYCHNDLQYGNIIYDNLTGECTIIDHEFGGMNYICCEFGNIFGEMAGLDMPDYTKYPDEPTQKRFIRMYLIETALIKGTVTL